MSRRPRVHKRERIEGHPLTAQIGLHVYRVLCGQRGGTSMYTWRYVNCKRCLRYMR